jgi:hypothetical protein
LYHLRKFSSYVFHTDTFIEISTQFFIGLWFFVIGGITFLSSWITSLSHLLLLIALYKQYKCRCQCVPWSDSTHCLWSSISPSSITSIILIFDLSNVTSPML